MATELGGSPSGSAGDARQTLSDEGRIVELPARALGGLAADAYRRTKQQIIRLEHTPGTVVTEAGLAASLGLSRTPVREMLPVLAEEGLVVVEGRGVIRVAPVTLRDVRDLCAARQVLEPAAAALAVRGVERLEDVQRLEQLGWGATLDPTDSASIAEFVRRNTEFHSLIATLSGNQVIADLLRRIFERLERVIHVVLAHGVEPEPEDWAEEHHELVNALISGDEDAARRVAAEQASRSQRRFVEVLLASDVVSRANVGDPHGA